MKYKTVFRLAIRAIGVLLLFEYLPYMFSEVVAFAHVYRRDSYARYIGADYSYFIEHYLPIMRYAVGMLCGAYLLFAGKWIIDLVIPSNRPYCHECGYDLTGLAASGACPECGTPKPADGTEQDK